MLQKEQIEKLLALNGVQASAPDDEIKSVLLSARWHKDDIEAAMLVLRENTITHQTHVDSLHKVFRTDERLRPETVSALLGIEMQVSTKEVTPTKGRIKRGVDPLQIVSIGVVAFILSITFVMVAMWHLEIGFFHQAIR